MPPFARGHACLGSAAHSTVDSAISNENDVVLIAHMMNKLTDVRIRAKMAALSSRMAMREFSCIALPLRVMLCKLTQSSVNWLHIIIHADTKLTVQMYTCSSRVDAYDINGNPGRKAR